MGQRQRKNGAAGVVRLHSNGENGDGKAEEEGQGFQFGG